MDRVALLVDWENLKSCTTEFLKSAPDVVTLKKIARRYGALSCARAYANWADDWHHGDMERIAQQGIEPVYVPTRRIFDGKQTYLKNFADGRLLCDGMELLAQPELTTFVVVSGDGSMENLFAKVAATGRRGIRVAVDKTVVKHRYALGEELVLYDDAVRGLTVSSSDAKVATALKEFGRAVQDVADRGTENTLKAVKAYMLSRDSAFQEETIGIPTFRHLAYLAEAKGLVRIDATRGEPAFTYTPDRDKTNEATTLPSGSTWSTFLRALKPDTAYTKRSLTDVVSSASVAEPGVTGESLVTAAIQSEMLWSRKNVYFDTNQKTQREARQLFLNTHHPRVQVYRQ